jgi:hypothetical protein
MNELVTIANQITSRFIYALPFAYRLNTTMRSTSQRSTTRTRDVPYRDFTFVHPPGIALFYLPMTLLADPSAAFSVALWLASLVGGVNIALSGWLVLRQQESGSNTVNTACPGPWRCSRRPFPH